MEVASRATGFYGLLILSKKKFPWSWREIVQDPAPDAKFESKDKAAGQQCLVSSVLILGSNIPCPPFPLPLFKSSTMLSTFMNTVTQLDELYETRV